jgi:hypothetical protein
MDGCEADTDWSRAVELEGQLVVAHESCDRLLSFDTQLVDLGLVVAGGFDRSTEMSFKRIHRCEGFRRRTGSSGLSSDGPETRLWFGQRWSIHALSHLVVGGIGRQRIRRWAGYVRCWDRHVSRGSFAFDVERDGKLTAYAELIALNLASRSADLHPEPLVQGVEAGEVTLERSENPVL